MNTSCSEVIDLSNSTNLHSYMYLPYEWVFLFFVLPCIIFLGMVNNVTFIWTFIRVPFLHTPTYIYLATLACTDLFTLIGYGVQIIDKSKNRLRLVELSIITDMFNVIFWMCFIASISLITVVSLERYLAICHPLKHRILKETKRTLKLIVSAVLLSSGLTCTLVPHIFPHPVYKCFIWPSDEEYYHYPRELVTRSGEDLQGLLYFQISTSVYSAVFFLILTTNCFMYINILSTLRARKQARSLQISKDFERNIQQMAIMVIANGLIFFLCSSIFISYMLYFAVSSLTRKVSFLNELQINIFENVRILFIVLNASVNPLVYIATNRRYRYALRTSILVCWCKTKTRNRASTSNIVLNTL